MCRGGSCEKIGISALKTAKEGVSRILKYKKEHSEIKQFGNNNNSVPKSKSILNKFEKGEVLRWSLRKKNPAAHTVPTCYCCVETLFKTRKKTRLRKRKEKKNKKKQDIIHRIIRRFNSFIMGIPIRVDMLITGNRLGTGP